jgi:hypothetical protein
MRSGRCTGWLAATLALAACSGGGEAAPRAADAFDCVWVADPTNCWRAMATSVATCLGGDAGAIGALSEDRRSCAYPSPGRSVTSSIPLGGRDADASPTRDFAVENASGVECIRVQEGANVLAIGYAGGTVRLATGGGRIELTCPSGAVFRGADADVRGCLSPATAIPGYAWAATVGADGVVARATFALNGVAVPLYACAYGKPTP